MAETLEHMLLDPSCSSEDVAELMVFFGEEEKQKCRDELAASMSQLLRIHEHVHSRPASPLVKAFVNLDQLVMENALRKIKLLDPLWSPPHYSPREGYWDENAQPLDVDNIPLNCDPLNYPFFYHWGYDPELEK